MHGRSPLLRLLSVVLVFGLWEWGGRIPISLSFPTCSQTLAALATMLADGTLLAAYADTIRPLIIGLLLCGVGIFVTAPLGYQMLMIAYQRQYGGLYVPSAPQWPSSPSR